MISEARLRANRANAQKSTGPKTEAGKLRSRCNALTHGLTGWGVVLPENEAEAVDRRVAEWTGSMFPHAEGGDWLARQAALASLRIDRCQQLELDRRGIEAARAFACWDEDRLAEAEQLGSRLSRDPSRVAALLRRTRQGCSWLLVRWRKLEALIHAPEGWQDEHRSLALDLLGEPTDTRSPDLALLASASPEALRTIVRGEIDDLETLMAEALDPIDDTERSLAEAGRPTTESPELRRLRRYESACWRRLWWSLGQLRSAHRAPAPSPSSYGSADLNLDLDPDPVDLDSPSYPPGDRLAVPAPSSFVAESEPPSPPAPPRIGAEHSTPNRPGADPQDRLTRPDRPALRPAPSTPSGDPAEEPHVSLLPPGRIDSESGTASRPPAPNRPSFHKARQALKKRHRSR